MQMDSDRVYQLITDAIRKERALGKIIAQAQKNTWLEFSSPIPAAVRKEVSKKLRKEGEVVTWLSESRVGLELAKSFPK